MTVNRETFVRILAIAFGIVAVYLLISLLVWPEGLNGDWQLSEVKKYYSQDLMKHLRSHQNVLIFHIVTALLMLLIGPFQFNKNFRNQNLKRHRFLGYLYLLMGTVSILSILPVSASSLGGFVTSTAAHTIAFFWFLSFAIAILQIRQKRTARHEIWMLRNFFLTAATFFIRPVFVVLAFLFPTVSSDQIFPVSFWLCLVVSMTLCHWYAESAKP